MIRHSKTWGRCFIYMILLTVWVQDTAYAQGSEETDKRVKEFLNSRIYSWRDMNVPASDGKVMYEIIVKNNYKSALEIGTSTGHSAIWIAWALSKTGGKLITIEIDARRYKEAMANFEKAGVAQYIDARLADAHELVKILPGPFDFVFSDADKAWYINYFKAIEPRLVAGGCFVAHNVGMTGVREYYEYVKSLPGYQTTVDHDGAGMAISYKKAER
jgi:caffeoyl-CoA O-methyltransferase